MTQQPEIDLLQRQWNVIAVIVGRPVPFTPNHTLRFMSRSSPVSEVRICMSEIVNTWLYVSSCGP